MIGVLRRLYPRGPANRGVALDAEGATLGPEWPLVRRTPLGFRCLSPIEAGAIQAAVLGGLEDPDWLFEQCRRIAESLARGDMALAQIYGLRIPVGELDDAAPRRLRALASSTKPASTRTNRASPRASRAPASGPNGDASADAGVGADTGAGDDSGKG